MAVGTIGGTLDSLPVFFGLTCGRLSGVDTWVSQLAPALSDLGQPATLLMTDPRASVGDRLELPPGVSRAELDLPTAGALAAFLTARAPCVFVMGYDYGLADALTLLPREVLVVLVAHSDDPFYYKHVVRWAPWADALVGVSPAIVEELSRRAPAWRGHIDQLSYGVAWSPKSQPRTRAIDQPLEVLYAGRLDQPQKRVLDLPRIVAAARAGGADIRLTVAGQGDAATALGREVTRQGLERVVTLAPTVPHARVPELFAKHDVLLLPSAFEGVPLVLLEGMASACPTVMYGLGSLDREIFRDQENIVLCPPGDWRALAHRLTELAHNEPHRQRLAIAAHLAVSAHGLRLEDAASRYVALFRRLVQPAALAARQRPPQGVRPVRTWPEYLPAWLRARANRWRQRWPAGSRWPHERGARGPQ